MVTVGYILISMMSLRASRVSVRRYCHRYSLYVIVTPCMCDYAQPFEVTNYLSLYGVNEKCVNNLLARYQEKLVLDLYRYCY